MNNQDVSIDEVTLDSIAKNTRIEYISYILIIDSPVPQEIEVNCKEWNDEIYQLLKKSDQIYLFSGKDTVVMNGSFFILNEESFVVTFRRVGLLLTFSEKEIHTLLKKCKIVIQNGDEQFTISNEKNEIPIITNYVKRRIGSVNYPITRLPSNRFRARIVGQSPSSRA